MLKILVELTLDESWNDYRYVHPEITLDEILENIPKGVGYKLIKKGNHESLQNNT